MGKLDGKRIAIMATRGVEQVELTEPRRILKEEGARVDVISPEPGKFKAWKFTDWGDDIAVDRTVDQAKPDEYDALVLPGGQINPDILRTSPEAVKFVRDFYQSGKTVAAICHGPWMLIEADAVRGRTVTSWPSIRTDLRNAGGKVVDKEVVVDGGVVTSRKPDDIPAFVSKIVEEVREGSHQRRNVA
jgi:protease I